MTGSVIIFVRKIAKIYCIIRNTRKLYWLIQYKLLVFSDYHYNSAFILGHISSRLLADYLYIILELKHTISV